MMAMAAGASFSPGKAHAQASDPFVGQIMIVGFNFCPRNWARAEGQLLDISSNTALFSLLGTTYGGDGRTTFGLPDLRGRSVVGVGNGPGLDSITWGERGGNYQHTLLTSQMPSHKHDLMGTNAVADQKRPNGDILAFPDYIIDGQPLKIYGNGSLAEVPLHPTSISNTGGGLAFNIRNPFLGMYVCISLTGIYPSRS